METVWEYNKNEIYRHIQKILHIKPHLSMKTIKNDENCTIRKMLYKEESLHEKNLKN